MKRSEFLKTLGLGAAAGMISCEGQKPFKGPIIVSTWDSGQAVNAEAWKILGNGGLALDAIEAGGIHIENEINCCVGLGGNPDRTGIVTLDASIMDHLGGIGSVGALERIKHPISLARRVMEKTPHVLLVGEGAQQFALEEGFVLEDQELSGPAARQFAEWLEKSAYRPKVNVENSVPDTLSNGELNHDTMGMIAVDGNQRMGGGVTTSGMGFKMRGRLGDSPIIGAGLYVDNEVGAATTSGVGEEVIRNAGSFLVVEYMRQGKTPEEACRLTVERIHRKNQRKEAFQVGFIALDNKGNFGAYSIQPGFVYAVKSATEDAVYKSPSLLT